MKSVISTFCLTLALGLTAIGLNHKTLRAETPGKENAIVWQTDFAAALKQAAEQDKEVLLRFTASWCPPCKVMEAEVWPNDEVAAAVNKAYVPVVIDVDLPEAREVALKFKVRSIPTIFRVDAKGATVSEASFLDSDQLISFLEAPDA